MKICGLAASWILLRVDLSHSAAGRWRQMRVKKNGVLSRYGTWLTRPVGWRLKPDQWLLALTDVWVSTSRAILPFVGTVYWHWQSPYSNQQPLISWSVLLHTVYHCLSVCLLFITRCSNNEKLDSRRETARRSVLFGNVKSVVYVKIVFFSCF